jgi:hypothetical protein
VVSYSLVSYERAFNFLKSRSAALRPIKPKAGWMGAAARGSPPRHAKRASGPRACGARKGICSSLVGTTTQPLLADARAGQSAKSCPDTCSGVDTLSQANRMSEGYPRHGEGRWGTGRSERFIRHMIGVVLWPERVIGHIFRLVDNPCALSDVGAKFVY